MLTEEPCIRDFLDLFEKALIEAGHEWDDIIPETISVEEDPNDPHILHISFETVEDVEK